MLKWHCFNYYSPSWLGGDVVFLNNHLLWNFGQMMNYFLATFCATSKIHFLIEFDFKVESQLIFESKLIKHRLEKRLALIMEGYCSMTPGCYKSPPLQEISSRDLRGAVRGEDSGRTELNTR